MADARCPAHCARWASDYLGYCLCSSREGISLGLGVASVLSWAIAEIPQIVTNYKTKSTEGLSFAFLFTWMIGDFFNVFGCLLEPATLPTQFYMAVLYAVTTFTLTSQSVYFGYIYHQLKCNKQFHKVVMTDKKEVSGEYSRDQNSSGEKLMSSPIPLPGMPRSNSTGQDSFYTSARCLSTNHTPRRSLCASWGAPITVDAEDSVEKPLLGGSLPTMSARLSNTKNLLCIVPAVTFIVGTLNFSHTRDTRLSVAVRLSSRKLLQVHGEQNVKSGAGVEIGSYMGWAMASIYMGARLPQICLNIKRGHVEGLNPLMFMFALLGNTIYVARGTMGVLGGSGTEGSLPSSLVEPTSTGHILIRNILVNSLEWSRIRPNLPWLVDAGGCALLDTFIICQFIYFEYRRSNALERKHGDANSTP